MVMLCNAVYTKDIVAIDGSVAVAFSSPICNMCVHHTVIVPFTKQVGEKASVGPVHVNVTVTPGATIMASPAYLIPAYTSPNTDIQIMGKFASLLNVPIDFAFFPRFYKSYYMY